MKKQLTPKVNVTLTVDNMLQIYINGLLHLSFEIDTLVITESYHPKGYYIIEFTLVKNGIVHSSKCEYKNRALWCEILKQLATFI